MVWSVKKLRCGTTGPADFQPGEFVANVYIDGFNLYYGALKGTPYKWLDLARLCQALLPSDTIQEIKYFTARVSAEIIPPPFQTNITGCQSSSLGQRLFRGRCLKNLAVGDYPSCHRR